MPELDEADLLRRATSAACRQWPGAEVVGLRRLPGGVSSLTFATTLRRPAEPDRPTVLKVAPPGVAPVRNRDVLRQSRLLHRMAEIATVPVPAIWFEDDGTPPMFAMALVDGDSYEPKTDVLPDPPGPMTVRRRSLAAAQALAEMQAIDLGALGLEAEPVLGLDAELERWAALLATVDDDIAPGHRDVYEALAGSLPEPLAPCLQHGDYRLGNMLFVEDRLTAIIDWEIWSVGDPRIDLAWLLMHTDPVHRFVHSRDDVNVRSGAGMASMAELFDAYAARRPGPFPDLHWFLAYCYFKVCSTIAVFVKRNRRRSDPDPALLVAATTLPDLLERARFELAEHRAHRLTAHG